MRAAEATPEQIEAMRERLQNRQECRRWEADINRSLEMVQNRKRGNPTPAPQPSAVRVAGHLGELIAALILGSICMVVYVVRRMTARDWLGLTAAALIIYLTPYLL